MPISPPPAVQDLALVIDGAPEIHPLTRNPDNHLIKMPSITRARAPLPQPLRHRRSELQHPPAGRFVGNLEPPLGKEIRHVAVAQGEAALDDEGGQRRPGGLSRWSQGKDLAWEHCQHDLSLVFRSGYRGFRHE
jgi:hypothetical protein